MCFDVNNIDENMYVEVHKYYLCIKFDIVFKIYLVVLFLHLKNNFIFLRYLRGTIDRENYVLGVVLADISMHSVCVREAYISK